METKNGLFGSLSGFTAAILLQPLENIKMVLMVPPKDLILKSNFLQDMPKAISYLYNSDGTKAFYRGVVPNVLRTAFSSSIFFSVLRFCQHLHQKYDYLKGSVTTSFSSSMMARIASSVISNPLSVVETRYQYGGNERWRGGVLRNLLKIYKNQGLKGYFEGGLTSCYKQGLFAGLFYALYNQGKKLGIYSLLAGIIAGMISTTITHPLEIVRAQIQSYVITKHTISNMGILKQIQFLFQSKQAFRGLAPRLIKKPLMNTLAFLMFQTMETKSGQ